MKILFGLSLLLPFLLINYRIIRTDITQKKIPNKYLLYLIALIPFWYIYAGFFGIFEELHLTIFLLQVSIIFITGFAIYYFHIWGAGDAKYLCVLCLFIPHIGIMSFIGNIGILTLGYLLFYFFWFWLGTNLWISHKRNGILKNAWFIKKEEFIHLNRNLTRRELIFKFLKWLNTFLVFFLSIRFLRIYLLSYVGERYDLVFLLQNYGIYLIFIGVVIIIAITLCVKYVLNVLKKYAFKTVNAQIYLMCGISMIATCLLLYGYFENPHYFSQKILLIFSVYLGLYILITSLWSTCKLVFKIQEEPLVHVDDIEEGTIIDKKWFDEILRRDKDIFGDLKISGKILNEEDLQIVKDVMLDVGKREKLYHIPTYKTFGFGGYIFLGFVVTYLFDSILVHFFIKAYQIFFL